jgi:DNA-binding transcriptional LysR family regulator
MPDTSPRVDLDLRLLRYFVTLAEYRTFARAAEALHLTQPSLSRQIRRLEQQLGARLLDRTPQGSRLTAAGEVLLPHAKTLLRTAERTAALTRAAAEPTRVTIGCTTNVIVTPAVRALRRRHPEAEVSTDEPLIRASDPTRDAFWRIDPRPDGSRAPDGPLVEDLEDKLELIASGRALAIVPGLEGHIRPYLTTVPLRDVEPGHVVLAVRADERSPLVAAFHTLARSLLTGPLPPVDTERPFRQE